LGGFRWKQKKKKQKSREPWPTGRGKNPDPEDNQEPKTSKQSKKSNWKGCSRGPKNQNVGVAKDRGERRGNTEIRRFVHHPSKGPSSHKGGFLEMKTGSRGGEGVPAEKERADRATQRGT